MDRHTLVWFVVLALALLGVNVYFEQSYQEKVEAWKAQQANKTLSKTTEEPSSPAISASSLPDKRESAGYYVLENQFQQLVFSSEGGALVEINLPFKDEKHPKSIVKPIEIDREMVREAPDNAFFPAHPYWTAATEPNTSPIEHNMGQLGGYYPLLRRSLNDKELPAQYYATNIVSDYPELAITSYQVKEFTPEKIVFESTQPHRKVTKTYTLSENDAPYCFTLNLRIEGDNKDLWLTSGVPDVELISNSPVPELKYLVTRQGKAECRTFDLPTDVATYSQIHPDWVSNANGFFAIISTPLNALQGGAQVEFISGEAAPSRLLALAQERQHFTAQMLPGYQQLLPLKLPSKSSSGNFSFRFFTGPLSQELLKEVDAFYLDPLTGKTPHYTACQNTNSWFEVISGPFAKFLFILMNFFHSLTGSWGFAIILLTVAVRVMLYPLNTWSMRSSLKMQQIMPEIARLQEKYKKEPKKAQLEIINLYREKGVNPLSGCVPLLIQLPFLIGMFDLLKTTFELRGASFIPGWIDNLAAPDTVFSWGFMIPFIGDQLHLLPILSGLMMLLQQRIMTPLPSDPSLMTEKERQQRIMGSTFSVIFAVMFYHFPSGINIYWIFTSLLGILQQCWMKRKMGSKAILMAA